MLNQPLREMPDELLYDLYDALDCLKGLDGDVAQLIYRELMRAHRDYVIDAMQLIIIELISDRR